MCDRFVIQLVFMHQYDIVSSYSNFDLDILSHDSLELVRAYNRWMDGLMGGWMSFRPI